MGNKLHFLLHGVRHLPRQYFPSFITFFDCSFENQILLLLPIRVILHNHNLTVLLVHTFALEVHLQLKFLQLLDNLLLGVGRPRVLRMQLSFLLLEL